VSSFNFAAKGPRRAFSVIKFTDAALML